MPVHYHDEPEVAELMALAEGDLAVAIACRGACRLWNVNTIPQLFAVQPDLVFELHEAMVSMVEQTPEADAVG